MLDKGTDLRVEFAVCQRTPRCIRPCFGERQSLRPQLGGAGGQRVETESRDRVFAGERFRFAQGSFFHHVSSVTLNSGAA